jgi:hypothetical protein
MDYPALQARRADLIMVSLMGTRRGEPAVDYTVNPGLGFPMATGPEGSTEPVAHVLPAWDCIAGQMVVSALLAAFGIPADIKSQSLFLIVTKPVERVEILLELKGLRGAVTFNVVDITKPRDPALLAKTRGSTALPVLELEDGRILKESLVLHRFQEGPAQQLHALGGHAQRGDEGGEGLGVLGACSSKE